MKSTGIVRKVDELGRIVIPMELRRTLENMQFSKQLINEHFDKPKGIFVTNNFHVLRGGFYAKRVGLAAQGVGSPTAFYYLPNAFTREFIGLLEMYKKRHLLALILFSIGWYFLFRAYV